MAWPTLWVLFLFVETELKFKFKRVDRQAFLMAQRAKGPPAVLETKETRVQSLDLEDPLEEDMATHSSILAWKIPVDRGAWRAAVHGVTELDMTERLSTAYNTIQKCFFVFS